MSRGLGKLQRAILDVLPWLDPYDERKRLKAWEIAKQCDMVQLVATDDYRRRANRIVPGSIYHALYALKRRELAHSHRGWARLPSDPNWRLAVLVRRNELIKKRTDDLVMQLARQRA